MRRPRYDWARDTFKRTKYVKFRKFFDIFFLAISVLFLKVVNNSFGGGSLLRILVILWGKSNNDVEIVYSIRL